MDLLHPRNKRMTFNKEDTDYTLYLVTNNELIPSGLDIYGQVEKSLQNGVTLVQLREKELDTGAFIARARKIHELCERYNVPLIINDRVDVALAVDAEGVHVGQDDMDPALVRKMIGPQKIIGLSIRNEEEMWELLKSGADVDYIGIGAVYSTKTKKVNKPQQGPNGVKRILQLISENRPSLKSVIIGGLNKYNITWALRESQFGNKTTDGVAVVSCIMAQHDAGRETLETLDSILVGFQRSNEHVTKKVNNSDSSVVHFITNSVAQQFSANTCIAVGGSPIMSENLNEFDDFTKIPNICLVLNTGTPKLESLTIYQNALKAYNANMRPVIFDPVGCGATEMRRELMRSLLSFGHFTVIKGNLGEIATLAGINGENMRGVDSTLDLDIRSAVDKFSKVAIDLKCVLVITGKTDIVINGILPKEKIEYCYVDGGDPLMANITASGCALGGVIARHVACVPYIDTFAATVMAVSTYKEAGYRAGLKSKGPGTFLANFVDELYSVSTSRNLENTHVTYM